jgi:hypothetical protein
MVLVISAQLLHRLMDQREMLIKQGTYSPSNANTQQLASVITNLPSLKNLTEPQSTAVANFVLSELDRRRKGDRLFSVMLTLAGFVAGVGAQAILF